MNEKPTLNIVLVEPRIPQNTGNVARTCACTACRLHLVGPMGFAIDDKKLKHAGLDYWHYLDISYYDSLDDFFSKNDGPFYYFTTKAPCLSGTFLLNSRVSYNISLVWYASFFKDLSM